MLLKGVCCREWPLLAMAGIGHCGHCGMRPVVVGRWFDRFVPEGAS